MAFFTRLLFTIFGIAFAVLFALVVVFWLTLYLAFTCMRWLLTGQKPQVLMMWQQIQAMRKGMQSGQRSQWSSWSRTSNEEWHEVHGQTLGCDHKENIIEDAVVREIHDTSRLSKD